MNQGYIYTHDTWPILLAGALLIVLSVYCWRRQDIRGALPFTVSCLLATLWVAGSFMEYTAVDIATKIFWVKFQAVWQLSATTATTCFVLEYIWPGRWLSRRNLTLLSLAPLLDVVSILTNDFYHLKWLGLAFDGAVIQQYGPIGWLLAIYSLGLGIVKITVFVWLFLHSPPHRWPVIIILTGQVAARVIFLLDVMNIFRSTLPVDILGVAFLYHMYAIALFGFHIFDPIPLAHQVAIEQLNIGMLILDPNGRIISLNPPAELLLQSTLDHAKGRLVRDLIPSYPGGLPTGDGEIELSLGVGQETRNYVAAITSLRDWHERVIGWLLTLRDITERKLAQAQIVEQQRLLATLQERERLALELHDSLGQTLAATHLQASTARILFAQGENVQLDKCLEQIVATTLAAEADVREYLLGAKMFLFSKLPFFEVLRQYVERFSQQYGVRIELSFPPELEAQGLGSMVEIQLLRIIQEALSNIRKHAHAKNAQIVFTVSGALTNIAIIDDGQGFDLALVETGLIEGFGLLAMRERAEALNGSLKIISQSGQGTQVVVQVQTESQKIALREV